MSLENLVLENLVLENLGLEAGEPIRFRRPDRVRWQDGVAIGRERDGSLSVSDRDGSHRAIPLEAVLVRGPGSGRRITWEPLAERISRTVQLELF